MTKGEGKRKDRQLTGHALPSSCQHFKKCLGTEMYIAASQQLSNVKVANAQAVMLMQLAHVRCCVVYQWFILLPHSK